jgi:hypothetical protein
VNNQTLALKPKDAQHTKRELTIWVAIHSGLSEWANTIWMSAADMPNFMSTLELEDKRTPHQNE